MAKDNEIEKKICITHEFRAFYVNVFVAKAYMEQPAKYYLVAVWDKKVDQSKPAFEGTNALDKIIRRAAIEKWGKEKNWPKKLNWPIRDGDESDQAEYKGKMYATLSAAKEKQPPVIDRDGETQIEDDDEFFSGCYARAKIIAGAYDQAGNRGVKLTLMALQKTKDGEPVGGASKSISGIFGSVKSDDEDDDDLDDDMDDEDTDDDDIDSSDDDDEDDEDDDEDEAPPPPKKKKKAVETKPMKKSKKTAKGF